MSEKHFRSVCAEVAERRGLKLKEIYQVSHARVPSWARQEAFYILWKDTKANGSWRFSIPKIAAHFGLDHTTVLYGIQVHMKREGLVYVGRKDGKGVNLLRKRTIAPVQKAQAHERAAARWDNYCKANGWPLEAA